MESLICVSSSSSCLKLAVRGSWDTQQRLPYNRNAPRKLKKNIVPPPPPISTPPITRKEQYVSQLLKRATPLPSLGLVEEQEQDETYLGYEKWLPTPPKVVKPRSVFNAATLAYIGDCIYELYARRHFLFPPLGIEEYNARVMAIVRCEAQDALLQKLLDSNFLSDQERDVLRWGKNIVSSKTKTKKRAGAAVYSRASSLETLPFGSSKSNITSPPFGSPFLGDILFSDTDIELGWLSVFDKCESLGKANAGELNNG
ncbi:mrnC, partial [Mucuna pruriens]